MDNWKPKDSLEELAVEIGNYYTNNLTDYEAYIVGYDNAKFIIDFILGF